MFALEVSFKDGSSPPTMIFVRRPVAVIGGSNFANVVLDDMRNLRFQLRVIRKLGRSFATQILPQGSAESDLEMTKIPSGLEGTFEAQRQFDLGPVKIEITAIDTDLLLRDGEAPDKAGVKSLRLAASTSSTKFPALLCGSPPMVISFNPEIPIIIGRSRPCALRLDSADVSGRHARVGFDGDNFWVEDLGSTNGTFVRGSRVAGKTKVSPGETIMVARESSVVGVASDRDLIAIENGAQVDKPITVAAAPQMQFPALVSLSPVAKPARLVLAAGSTFKVGRDPVSDLWLGAPHISRHHCSVFLGDDGVVSISDQSTNGTEYDSGRLERGQILKSQGEPHVLNFGAGVTVAVCFSDEHERRFKRAQGAVATFGGILPGEDENLGENRSENVKISDVSKLLGKRGRQATAHQLQALLGSGGKSVRFLLWLAIISLFVAVCAAILLAFSILF